MSNKKSTKRSLVFSILSLLLCMTMLVGTTFAWFTDSVTSGKNQIVAGNLDVAFEYYTENGWADVEGKTDLVDPDALWEPGHAEVVYLKVSNVGTLALKYQLALNVFSEVLGVNKEGKNIKLSEYLKYGVLNDVEPGAFATREDALEAVEKDLLGARALADHSEVASLLPEEFDTFALVIWMPTTVGNEANHNGVNVPSIELGVSVAATQFSSEEDSFDKYYDADAFKPVANVDDLALKNNKATWGIGGSEFDMNLDTAYSFLPTETYEDAQNSPYRYWHADFVVKIDKDVNYGEAYLAGYYSAWCDGWNDGKWVALTADLPANTEVRLVDGMGDGKITVNYEEICNYAMLPENTHMGFLCGAGDMDDALAGATLTVELRLYETTKAPDATSGTANEETGEYITVGSYSYTFSKDVANDAELAEAIAAGQTNIKLATGEYTLPATLSNVALVADGTATVNIPTNVTTVLGENASLNGITFVGDRSNDDGVLKVAGKNVTVENCVFNLGDTNTVGIAVGGGVNDLLIKNCVFNGGYKQIGPVAGNPGNVVIDGCVFNGGDSVYGIHMNAGVNGNVTVKNCTIGLFNTFFGFGDDRDKGTLTFENCDFVVVEGKTNVVKLYRDASFVNCDFEEGFLFSDANNDANTHNNWSFVGGSWGNGTIKDHFLNDSFADNLTATFDDEVYFWDTTTDTWTKQ